MTDRDWPWNGNTTIPNPPAPSALGKPIAEGATAAGARRHVARFFRSHALASDAAELPGFRHSHARIGSLSLNHLTYGTPTTVGIPPLLDFYMLQWTLAGSARYRHDGTEEVAAEGAAYVVNPDRPYEKHWDAACTQLIVRIDRSLVDDAISTQGPRTNGHILEPVIFAPNPVPETTQTASLFGFLRALARDVESGTGYADPALTGQVGALLAGLMLVSLRHSEMQSAHRHSRHRPRHLSAAEDFLKVHARSRLRLDDIAEAAGVRPRTLHKAFRAHHGVGPMAYLRQVRLDLARRDLMEAGRTGRSVTDVATDCGFDHLSKFAEAYRARYGERPSETLRRFRPE